jgi:hypothetical protein
VKANFFVGYDTLYCGVYLLYIQGVSGGIINILGGDSMDYSE